MLNIFGSELVSNSMHRTELLRTTWIDLRKEGRLAGRRLVGDDT